MKRYRSHRVRKKHRMGVGQKRKILILTATLVIFVLLLGVFLATQKPEQDFNKQDLSVRQLSCFLSFYEYDEQQWNRYLIDQGMQEVVHWNELEALLNALGVKEYVTYQCPGQDEVVSCGDFLQLYDQLLSLLDGEGKVKQKTITVESTIDEGNAWKSGTLVADGEKYQILTAIEKYTKGSTYLVYLLDSKILGIAENYDKKITGKTQTQDLNLTDEDRVTVLLKNASGIYRDKIYLVTKGEYTKTGWKGKQQKLESGHLLKFVNCNVKKDPEEDEYLLLKPEDGSGRIYFTDKTGKKLSKGYRGNFRIYRYKKGYVVVNELSIREYLYGVVPSEMPSYYEEEALKAQAVCARSYTYKHLLKRGSAGYYADLDDSVQYQVYNKSCDAKSTRKAVKDTANEVLTYQDELAETYYFSTSGGITQGYDLWGLDQEEYGYLNSAMIHKDGEKVSKGNSVDLSEEEKFKEFMELKISGFYEKDCRYFRWKANLDYKKNVEALNKAILQRKQAAPKSVRIKNKDGETLSKMGTLGKPEKIFVKKRSLAGGITTLVFQYEKGSVELTTEYTIRYCLGACDPTVKLLDGSSIQPEILPSAWFYISSSKNGKAVLCGGGFGHGLGMSQNGADKLAQAGWNYKDILQFFYHGVELVEMVN